MRYLISFLTVVALYIVGCGGNGGGVVPCSRVDEILDRTNPAELTEAPSFSASEIAPGDPLLLMIPVNGHTKHVGVDVRSVDGQSAVSVPSRETNGDETLVFPMQTTGLPPGIYMLRIFTLSGEIPPENSTYDTSTPDGTYRLGATEGVEHVLQCLTEIPVASFTLVASDA